MEETRTTRISVNGDFIESKLPWSRKPTRVLDTMKSCTKFQVDRVDDLVDGYSQFTALADEASKGVTVGGVSDPLGRPASAAAVTAPTAVAAAAAGAPVDRRFGTPRCACRCFLSGSKRCISCLDHFQREKTCFRCLVPT